MTVHRMAILSVHTSPIAAPGGKKIGGMNVYIRELTRELAQRGITIDIYTRRFAPDQPDVDQSLGKGVNVIHVNAGSPHPVEPDAMYDHLSQFAAGVIAYATRHNINYDLVYSHYWLSGWVAHKLDEVWNVPFIQMFHTLGHMKHRIGAGPITMPDTRIRTETQIVEWADRIIAATPAELAQLMWLYRADRRKISVIPPGVDSERFRPIPLDEAKSRLDIPQENNLLLFVGRLEPLKAVDTILESAAVINQQTPELLANTSFAIIGGDLNNSSDPEMSRLKALSKKLGVGDVVHFLGAKDHDLLPYYYAAALAVIMPSDYESFGMVALEAMSAGTPVIASEVGGLAFLVRDAETGYLIPTRNPEALAVGIRNILLDPQKYQEMSQNAVTLARNYQWSHIADQLLPIFDDALAKKRPWTFNHRRR